LRVMPTAPSREPSARGARSIRSVKPSWSGLRSLAARAWTGHRLFIIVLTPAFLLRLDAELGYRWQAWFNDSFQYVQNTVTLNLDPTRVSGYSLWLKLFQVFHTYAIITILQHLMALAVAVMIYALARHRFRVPAWLATLATVPMLYDGFGIQLEHLILSDIPFLFVLTLAVTLLLWDPQPSMRRCVFIGLLLGIDDLLRSVALPLLAVFVVYMLIRRISWKRVAAAIVVCLLPVVAYAGAFEIQHGQFAMTDSTGVFLYSRVMTFADCAKMGTVPASELFLCDPTPPAQRPIAQAYIWTSISPLDRMASTKFSPAPNQLAEKFAVQAIKAQPLSYAKTVFDDTWRVFAWKRTVFPQPATYDEYLFGYHSLPIPSWDEAPLGPYDSYASAYVHGDPLTHVVAPFANIIRGYQRYIWLPGAVYGLILLAGLGGMVLAWRRLGGEALLPWTISLALIVIPAATAEFDYRYVLVAVPFACLAAALAFSPGTAGGDLARRLRARLAGRKRRQDGPAGPAEVTGEAEVAPLADRTPAGARGAGHDQRDLASDGT
jgi:hypothetical protein